ncbi:ornithine cyclodeaminase [Actinoplanes sp. SE50]|uniref:ornithine cyclodeaminase family protein n=1 Tax=unclassified Actinoplanes TaxID=2626549 RepID=UPI00023EC49B|nr:MULTISPECIES: ornithine cyclodeaminase family protein [unclassified Actinoplanes]AEV85263.1 ornithine cyclodeaminase [Actinoplanes sp. SE50/110]ATO83658.1 ornithine cyclodeaminase [Actinoplanes sp. SE50]SLM01066.1 ornithine cyclodeaminase [Actinoplanes sp. SE50/110]
MLVLTGADVEALCDLDALTAAMATALRELSCGRAHLPPRASLLVDGAGLLDMPSWIPALGALTTKVVSVFPGNAGGDVPVRQAMIVVFDPENGVPVAMIDAGWLTAARTAACSALSVRLLARPDAAVLAIAGTGVQARAHAVAVSRVRPFREVRVAGSSPDRAAALAEELSAVLPMRVRAVADHRTALRGADVVCGASFAVRPPIRREWLAPGTHVTSVGYRLDGREVDDATVAGAALFVESRDAALRAVPPTPDLAQPLAAGLITAGHVRAELGEVIAGTAPGRLDDAELTLYKSVGVAVQDGAAAALLLAAARDHGRGQEITGFSPIAGTSTAKSKASAAGSSM